jgi:hypothetical protein
MHEIKQNLKPEYKEPILIAEITLFLYTDHTLQSMDVRLYIS